ncbi:MAG: nucleotidyltransferase domain-containing protein [Ruminococcaceae bacterium]|nr:nucleotidyltransferase domain-containing protein [Oscillospiraceae bacterium]
MIDISVWVKQFVDAVTACFGERVLFIGLQGSYGRGEASDTSDIDMVVILDTLSATDIAAYRKMLDTLPHRELICGFLSGKDELLHWEPSDLFQFYYDTKPLKGNLDDLRGLLDTDAVERAIRIGVCNLYHGCVHNMLYEKSEDILKSLYKSASFAVQAICYRKTGQYVSRQKELAEMVDAGDRRIVEIYMELKQGGRVRFDEMSEILFAWSGSRIKE